MVPPWPHQGPCHPNKSLQSGISIHLGSTHAHKVCVVCHDQWPAKLEGSCGLNCSFMSVCPVQHQEEQTLPVWVLVQDLVISCSDYWKPSPVGFPACTFQPIQIIKHAVTCLVFNKAQKSSYTVAITPSFRSILHQWKESGTIILSFATVHSLAVHSTYLCWLNPCLCHISLYQTLKSK